MLLLRVLSTYPTRTTATSYLSRSLHSVRTGPSSRDPGDTLRPISEVVTGDSWQFEEDRDSTDTQLNGRKQT